MVNVLIKTDTRYPVNRKTVRRAVFDTFKKFKIDAGFEVSVIVVGARKMKKLTDDFLGDFQKHQILTFALNEESKTRILKGADANDYDSSSSLSAKSQGFVNPPDGILRLGDVVLCWPEVLISASEDDMMVDEEVYDLVCHGTEHLLGYGHSSLD